MKYIKTIIDFERYQIILNNLVLIRSEDDRIVLSKSIIFFKYILVVFILHSN